MPELERFVMGNEKSNRGAAGRTWHGAARPQWAGNRLLSYLFERENADSTEGVKDKPGERSRIEARAAAEMLSNAALSLEARLSSSLGAWDRHYLSTIVGVFSGLSRMLDSGDCASVPKLKEFIDSPDIQQASGEDRGRVYSEPSQSQRKQTSAKWAAVFWENNRRRQKSTSRTSPKMRRQGINTWSGAKERVTGKTLLKNSDRGNGASGSQLLMYAKDVARLYRSQRFLHSQINDMEKNLQVTEKAAAAGLLSSGVFHDVNHYLAVIRSAAELLQSELTNVSQTSREDLEAISMSAGRAGSLIHKFQFMARPGSEQGVNVDLIEVLKEAKTLMKRQLDKNEIRLIIEVKPHLPTLLGDPAGLEEVIINLVGNAIEILEPGGSVRIVADSRKVGDGEDGTEVLLLVEDTGPGVPEELVETLFDPFVTGREGGTGLGLYLVKRIVERHGGQIRLFSQPGQGARFLIMLPVLKDSSSTPEDQRQLPNDCAV